MVVGRASIGTVEEGFIARLKSGDCFVFSGRVLEYVRTQDMTAYVRKATKSKGIVPAWGGTKMALSEAMTDMVQALLDGSAQGDFLEPEMQAAHAHACDAGPPVAAADQRDAC